MTSEHAFASSLLDSTLSAQAAGVALALREVLGREACARLGSFEELTGDCRMRLRHLCESVALARAQLYVDHIAWQRTALVARGVEPGVLEELLACQRRVLSEGLPPLALKTLEPFLAAGEQLLREPAGDPPSALSGPYAAAVARILEGALSGRRDECRRIARELLGELGEDALVEGVLVGVQFELGRLWQRGELHTGEEHLATRIVEGLLAELSSAGECEPSIGRSVLIASPAGDLHEVGARMVARRFERRGWNVFFLGANVPCQDLLASVRDFAPDLLLLSVSQGLHVRAAAEVIRATRAERRLPVLVGGAPFRLVPDLWAVVGAEAAATSAVEAEAVARRLVGLTSS